MGAPASAGAPMDVMVQEDVTPGVRVTQHRYIIGNFVAESHWILMLSDMWRKRLEHSVWDWLLPARTSYNPEHDLRHHHQHLHQLDQPHIHKREAG